MKKRILAFVLASVLAFSTQGMSGVTAWAETPQTEDASVGASGEDPAPGSSSDTATGSSADEASSGASAEESGEKASSGASTDSSSEEASSGASTEDSAEEASSGDSSEEAAEEASSSDASTEDSAEEASDTASSIIKHKAEEKTEHSCTIDISDKLISCGGFITEDDRIETQGDSAISQSTVDKFNGIIADAIDNMSEKADVEECGITVSQFSNSYLLYNFLNGHPEYYYVTGNCTYYYNDDDIVTAIGIRYRSDYNSSEKNEIEVKVAGILDGIDKDWKDEQKALYLHDYIVTHCQYDNNEGAHQYDMKGVLLEETAVCQGYAAAYMYLMNKAGVPCEMVISNSMGHGWNLVELNGKFYYVDCTWDDPTISNNGHMYRLYCRHSNFLRSKDGLVSTGHKGNDWLGTSGHNYDCETGDDYEGRKWISNSNSSIPIVDNKGLLFSDEELFWYDFGTDSETDTGIKTDTDSGGLAACNDTFYYSTSNEIYKIDSDNGTTKVVELSSEDADYKIYGIESHDGAVYYDLGSSDNEADYVRTDTYNPGEGIPLTGIALSESEYSLKMGNSFELSVSPVPDGGIVDAVSWSSDDINVASVDKVGKVTALSCGKAVVTARCGRHTAACLVTVSKDATGIVISPETLDIYVGSQAVLTAAFVPEDASEKEMLWSSSDQSIAEVDNNGTVKAVAPGTAIITASSKINESVSGTCTFNVKIPAESVSITDVSQKDIVLSKGSTMALSASITPDNADENTISWKSSDTSVVKVNEEGLVTAVSSGNAIVFAFVKTNDGREISDQCYFEVLVPAISIKIEAIGLTDGVVTLNKDEELYLRTKISPDDSTDIMVNWKSSNESVVSVSDGGIAKANGSGSATITAEITRADATVVNSSCVVNVNVPVTDIEISESLVKLEVNETTQLSAGVLPTDATDSEINWSSDNELVATVDENGLVSAHRIGTAYITARSNNGLSRNCNIVVEDADVTNDEDIDDESFESPDGIWISGLNDEMVYSGNSITQQVRVYYGENLLREGTEYSISYSNNKDVGTASMFISGKGNYTGKAVKRFEIKAADINNASISIGQQATTGKALKPKATVIYAGRTLKENKDYSLKYGVITDANTEGEGYVIKVDGIGNFEGEAESTFVVQPKGTKIQKENPDLINIKNGSVTGLSSEGYDYTGTTVYPEFEVYSGKNGTGDKLQDSDYDVTYAPNVSAGKVTITITGKESAGYTGTLKSKYVINKISIKDCIVNLPNHIVCAKGGATPVPVVTFNSSDGKTWTLREGIDYTLKYSNNTSSNGAKNATVTVTGKGNFKDKTEPMIFVIENQYISALNVIVDDKKVNGTKKGSYYYSKPEVYDVNGKQLSEKKDYTVAYTLSESGEPIGKHDILSDGTKINVTVSGTGENYIGSKTVTYTVREVNDINKAKCDSIEKQSYTGDPIKPEISLYTVTGSGKSAVRSNLTEGTDYEIVGYYDNVKKGTASVIINGIGIYSGSKKLTFKIVAANTKSMWKGWFNGTEMSGVTATSVSLGTQGILMNTNQGAVKLNPVYGPENADPCDLIWKSADTKIATVDKNGSVKGKNAGTTKITVMFKDDHSISSTCLVSVY